MKPLTYLFDFEFFDDSSRPYMMHELAANGVENIVLSDTLLNMMAKNSAFVVKLQKEMAEAGLHFVDAHAPFGVWEDMDVPVPSLRRTLIERKRLSMSLAADFGVDTITIHVGNGPKVFRDMGYTLSQFDDAIVRSLEELLPYAEKLGIVICIENIWFPTNTTEKLLGLVEHFKSDNLGICYDAGHANLTKYNRGVKEANVVSGFADFGLEAHYDDKLLERVLPHVVNCHLHDNNGLRDEHQVFGNGNVDWPHVIGLLKTAPRLRSFQSEVIPVRMAMVSVKELVQKFQALFGVE